MRSWCADIKPVSAALTTPAIMARPHVAMERVFPQVDGALLRTRGMRRHPSDADVVRLAGYLVHIQRRRDTVLSLGCQHAQIEILREEIAARTALCQAVLHL